MNALSGLSFISRGDKISRDGIPHTDKKREKKKEEEREMQFPRILVALKWLRIFLKRFIFRTEFPYSELKLRKLK